MGKQPSIKNRVRPAFLARRFCVSQDTIRRRILDGSIEAKPERVNPRNKKPSGYWIKRSEVERLDRVGLRAPHSGPFKNELAASHAATLAPVEAVA